MTSVWLAFWIGAMIGGVVGMVAISLCVIARQGDNSEDLCNRRDRDAVRDRVAELPLKNDAPHGWLERLVK